MKILHTIYDDLQNPWWGGGGAVRVYEVCRRLAKQHEITVLTGNFAGATREEEIEGIRYVRIGSPRGRWASRLSYSLLTPGYVKRSGCDLWVNHFSAFSPVVARREPCIVVVCHLTGMHALRKYPVVGLVSYVAENYALRHHRHIMTISPTVDRLIRTKLPNGGRDIDIKCIFVGIDSGFFDVAPTDGDYILYLGRFDLYMKGIDVLLAAFADVVGRTPAVRLKMAGRGADRLKIQGLVDRLGLSERVDILGSVTEAEKRELLGGALLVCMPSRFEGWGITAIEAAASGKAVIGTAIAGLSDAIRDGETGMLVPPDSPDALSDRLLHLIDNPDERHRLGANGRLYARQFDWSTVSEEEEQYCLSTVAQHRTQQQAFHN